MALSSTMIVVKLLYDKHELMTLPGRITLGILVFQDIWAILVLAVQPTLLDPVDRGRWWARSSRVRCWWRRAWPPAATSCPRSSPSSPRCPS